LRLRAPSKTGAKWQGRWGREEKGKKRDIAKANIEIRCFKDV
jgi:hypothetical protein